MDIDAHRARIGCTGTRPSTLEVLSAIARCHPQAIPFETFSVAAGGVPELSIDALEAKLVRAGRGGYCCEQNSVLQAALIEIGFRVTGLWRASATGCLRTQRPSLPGAAALCKALREVFSITAPESELGKAAEVSSRGQALNASFT